MYHLLTGGHYSKVDLCYKKYRWDCRVVIYTWRSSLGSMDLKDGIQFEKNTFEQDKILTKQPALEKVAR